MTDRKRLTRRDSLKGIAAAGTVIGGATVGLSTALADDDSEEKDDEKQKEEEDDEKRDETEKNDEKYDDESKDHDKDEKKDGKNDEKEKHDDKDDEEKHDGEKDGKKDDKEEEDSKKKDDKEKHDDEKDDKKHDGDGKDDKKHDDEDDKKRDVDAKIDLIPVCYEKGKDGKKERAKFRVENLSKKDVKVGWKRHCDGKRDYLEVAAGGSECFWVGLGRTGTATVSLYHDGKKIATADADTKTRCDCRD